MPNLNIYNDNYFTNNYVSIFCIHLPSRNTSNFSLCFILLKNIFVINYFEFHQKTIFKLIFFNKKKLLF